MQPKSNADSNNIANWQKNNTMLRRFTLWWLFFLFCVYFVTIQQYLWNQHCRHHASAVECQSRQDADNRQHREKKPESTETFQLTQNFVYLSNVLKEYYQIRTGLCRQEVVVLVSSKADNFELRKAIRDTWASVLKANIKVVFVTGKLPPLPWPLQNFEAPLINEINMYKDLLVGNFIDEIIYTTTVKYLFGFKWILSNCNNAKLIFCVEDTMFVNLTLAGEILDPLLRNPSGKLWIGNKRVNQPASHLNSELFEWFGSSHKYYVPHKNWPHTNLPPLCVTELGFILSIEAVEHVYQWSWNNTLFPRPDVHIAISAFHDRNWNITHIPKVTHTSMEGNLCAWMKYVITNEFTNPDYFHKAWKGLKDDYDFQLNCHNPNVEHLLPKVSNRHYFDRTLGLIHDVRHTCLDAKDSIYDDKLFLLMLISSHPSHFAARQAIRSTWGSIKNVNKMTIRLLFILGVQRKYFQTYQTLGEVQDKIHQEYQTHQDIIQANFTEHHRNLTLKVVLGLRWVTENCPNAKFVFKGDDDVFVNVKQLLMYLSSLSSANRLNPPVTKQGARDSGYSSKRLFLGSINTGPVVRDDASKYFVDESVYPAKFYPPFLSGGGYVMSRDIIPKLYETSLFTYLLPLDDVYQGILAKRIGVEPTTHKFFRNAGGSKDVCLLRNSTFTLHRFEPSELMQVWNVFLRRQCVNSTA